MLDEHMGKIEEWVERSRGKVHADVIHARLVAVGFTVTEGPRDGRWPKRRLVAVRHPQIVQVARSCGTQVVTCVPFDPESKGGLETTVKIAKADAVPTQANLRADYASFAELEAACEEFTAQGQKP